MEVCIVITPSGAMSYINVVRYFPGDTTFEAERLDNPKENNVPFSHNRFAPSTRELSSFRFISDQERCSIVLGEDRVKYYLNEHQFHL